MEFFFYGNLAKTVQEKRFCRFCEDSDERGGFLFRRVIAFHFNDKRSETIEISVY